MRTRLLSHQQLVPRGCQLALESMHRALADGEAVPLCVGVVLERRQRFLCAATGRLLGRQPFARLQMTQATVRIEEQSQQISKTVYAHLIQFTL